MKPHITRPELFLIPHDLVNNHNVKEAKATYADMEKLDIAHLPYPNCMIGVAGHAVFTLVCPEDKFVRITRRTDNGKIDLDFPPNIRPEIKSDFEHVASIYNSFEARFHYHNERCFKIMVRCDHLSHWRDLTEFSSHEEIKEGIEVASRDIRILLIVLLATKNTIQTRTKDKLIALGIGKNSRDPYRPIYTTTISLPSNTEPQSHILIPGSTKRPHLRRGHIRQQKYGPRLSFTRPIWIEPCYINTPDPGAFTSTREAYNTSLTAAHSIPSHHHH